MDAALGQLHGRQRLARQAYGPCAAQHLGGRAARVAQVVQTSPVAPLQRDFVVQRRQASAFGGRRQRGRGQRMRKAQRQRRRRRLAQGAGQVQSQALQIAGDGDFRRAAAHAQVQYIVGLALGRAGDVGQQAQFARLAQPFGAGRARGTQLQR
ncbi:hypothetical protein D3C78_1205710 [compost metagenome]